MSSVDTSTVPVLQICEFAFGYRRLFNLHTLSPVEFASINIQPGGFSQPDTITISHSVPENHKDFANQRNDINACDISIIMRDKKLYGHKQILSSRIPYFFGLFNSNMNECTNGEIDFSSTVCDFSILACLLDYAYTGILDISVANVQDLMIAADYLQMEAIMNECVEFMKYRLTFDNVLSIRSFCRLIGYTIIDASILNFIDKTFVPVALTAKFLDLPVEDLVHILQRDSLHVDDEAQMFEAVDRWMEHCHDRKRHAARLLNCVRCTQLSETFISDVIEKIEWVIEDSESLTLVREAKEFISNRDKRSDTFNKTERICYDAHRLIFSWVDLKSNDQQDEEITVELYDPTTNKWTQGASGRISHHLEPLAVINHNIYFFGGFKFRPVDGQIYDTLANEWSKMPNIPGKICLMSTGVIDGKIYVAGGRGEFTVDTLLAYNPSTQEWSSLPGMSIPRENAASCVFEGKLYVFGGNDRFRRYREDCECFDPESNSWSPISKMNQRRSAAGAAVLNGKLYVVGGCDGSEYLNQVERFDPKTKEWTVLSSMKSRRALVSLVVSCGKLFAVGGSDNVHDPSCTHVTMEVYDPEKDSWDEKELMSEYFGKIGTIPIPAHHVAKSRQGEHCPSEECCKE